MWRYNSDIKFKMSMDFIITLTLSKRERILFYLLTYLPFLKTVKSNGICVSYLLTYGLMEKKFANVSGKLKVQRF